MLVERRWAHLILLIGSIGAAGVPYLHMMGRGLVGGRAANYSGVFFWVWTLLAGRDRGAFPRSCRRADCGACHGSRPSSS